MGPVQCMYPYTLFVYLYTIHTLCIHYPYTTRTLSMTTDTLSIHYQYTIFVYVSIRLGL